MDCGKLNEALAMMEQLRHLLDTLDGATSVTQSFTHPARGVKYARTIDLGAVMGAMAQISSAAVNDTSGKELDAALDAARSVIEQAKWHPCKCRGAKRAQS